MSSDDGLRAQYGSRGATAYRSAENPNEVLLLFDWDDDLPYTAYFELPEVKSALAASGSVPDIAEVSEVFHLSQ